MLEGKRELLVVVTGQELGLGALRLELPGQIPRLLAEPRLVRVRADSKPQDASGPQLHKEVALVEPEARCSVLHVREEKTSVPPVARAGVLMLGGECSVNRLGFGAMRLTGDEIWGDPASPDECRAVLHRAVELGVNFIDTADSYGPEVSERLIAEALRPYPDDLVIATKGGLMRQRPESWEPNGRPEHLRAACEGSLRRLGIDEIDLYQFHRPDPKVPFEESLGTLVNLRNEGKIRHIGVCNVTVEQLRVAMAMTRISSVQNRYNLLDRGSENVLELCEREGIPFIPWYPLATRELMRLGGPLTELGMRHGATPAQLALVWLLARSPVMLPIPGTASVGHLEENVAAAGIHLDEDQLERLESTVSSAPPRG